jgi:antitoxin component YwqK of YwqJK toxin-antitoxin module
MRSEVGKFVLLNFFLVFSWSLCGQKSNPNGYNRFYYENGKLSSEGYLKDGKPDGYWKNYYPNGKVKIEGNRRNFELDSTWNFYDERGHLTRTISYQKGQKNGPTITYDTLKHVVSVETYSNDLKEGATRTFYPNGAIKSQTPFIKGKQEGTAYEFSRDSLITGIATYKGGILQGYEKINQKDEENKKQGIWKEFYGDMTVKKIAKYNSDSLDGYVKEYDAKGNLLSTKKYNNGKRIMNAPEIANVEVYREVYEDGTLKYEGVYSDGDPIGTHYRYKQVRRCDSSIFRRDDTSNIFVKRMVCRNVPMPDSAIEYFNGIMVAKGAVDSIRRRQGLWIEYHNTGEFSGKGIYKDDKRTGEWEFYYPNGKTEQKGRFDNKGREQGAWKWYYESGRLYREEYYVNGKLNGELKEYNEEGKVTLQGEYVDNRKEGRWVYETENYLEYGNYVNDEPDSLWRTFYMPGKVKRFEGKFVAGQPEGQHLAWHPNGARKYSGSYTGGMKNGDWKYFDENDYNYLTINFRNDIEVKWQGEKIRPTYEESLRTYNIRINENKSQTIRK